MKEARRYLHPVPDIPVDAQLVVQVRETAFPVIPGRLSGPDQGAVFPMAAGQGIHPVVRAFVA